MVDIRMIPYSEKELVKVRCTECGEMTWNTYTKLCNTCYRYKDDIGDDHDR